MRENGNDKNAFCLPRENTDTIAVSIGITGFSTEQLLNLRHTYATASNMVKMPTQNSVGFLVGTVCYFEPVNR